MGRNISSVIMVLMCIAFAGSAQQGKRFGKITLPLGKVEVQSAETSDWTKAKMQHPVFVNDKIRTGTRSRVEITLTGGGKLRLGENSEIELTEAKIDRLQKEFNAKMKKGKAWIKTATAFGERKNVTIRTPTAVAAIRGTKYRVEAGDKESSVLVYQGEVEVNRPENLQKIRRDDLEKRLKDGGPPKFRLGPVEKIDAPTQVAGPYEVSLEDWIKLVEGMQINIRADGKYHMFEFDKAADNELDWVKWNKEQDEQK